MEQLCIIYEVEGVDVDGRTIDAYYPRKAKAIEVGEREGSKVHKIRVSGAGGTREAVCRLAQGHRWILSKELEADLRPEAPLLNEPEQRPQSNGSRP
jgi:hypothetical protein